MSSLAGVLVTYDRATIAAQAKKEGRPDGSALPLSTDRQISPPDGLPPAVLSRFFRLVMDQRGLVEDFENLGQRRFLVGLLHRSELACQARRGGFENLPLRIA